MSLADLYPWVKALHVASTLVFIAGLFAQALFMAAIRDGSYLDAAGSEVVRRFYQVERRLTTPAMIVLLASGLTIALVGKWFPSAWLIAKLTLVAVLFGVHGFQSGQLRRAASGKAIASRNLRYAILPVVSIIAILAVVKP
jgi:uncharacterized membrane protein